MKKNIIKLIAILIVFTITQTNANAQTCDAPEWIHVDDITPTHLLVSCAPVPGALSYEFEYSTELSPPVIINSLVPNAAFIILPGDEISCRVRTHCLLGATSDNSGIYITVDIVYEKVIRDFDCDNINIPFNNPKYKAGYKEYDLTRLDKCCACIILKNLYDNKLLYSNGESYIIEGEQFSMLETCKNTEEYDPCETNRNNARLQNKLNTTDTKSKEYNIQVYDMNGRCILDLKNINESNDTYIKSKLKEINISSGVYIIQILSANQAVSRKIVF